MTYERGETMTHDELIAELKRLINVNKYTNPAAAGVLAVLIGALFAGAERELFEQCADFARADIIRIQAGL